MVFSLNFSPVLNEVNLESFVYVKLIGLAFADFQNPHYII